jgi:hypothetical protein
MVLVKAMMPPFLQHGNGFPGTFQFDVGHHYLRPQGPKFQSNTPSNSPASAGFMIATFPFKSMFPLLSDGDTTGYLE